MTVDQPEEVDETLADGADPSEYEDVSAPVGDEPIGEVPLEAEGASSSVSNKYRLPNGQSLRGDAAASYLRMLVDGLPSGGVQVFSRTYAQQAELRRRYELGLGPLAARPNANAPHIKGVAMDLQTTSGGKYRPSAAHEWLTKGGVGSSAPKSGEHLRAHKYGWRRTVPSERWHFGYDPAKDQRAKADLKTRLRWLGYKSLKAFQKSVRLTADGKAGPLTWTALLEACETLPLGARVLRRGYFGTDVAALSALLKAKCYDVGEPVDQFGPAVEKAVKNWQKKSGLVVDGLAGPATIKSLKK